MVYKTTKRKEPDATMYFTRPPISDDEAREKWPLRYSSTWRKTETIKNPKKGSKQEKDIVENMKAISHYSYAKVNNRLILNLDDDVYIKSSTEKPNNIGKIVELFEGVDGNPYFTAQLFYRAEDTVIKHLAEKYMKEKKRVFLSNVEKNFSLKCIQSKLKIVKIQAKILSENEEKVIPPGCDFYYDLKYELEHLTFSCADTEFPDSQSDSSENYSNCVGSNNEEKYLLDLYAGCGAMSTGLCMGASFSGVNLITKWAVDINTFACESLKFNHPETNVRNEPADNFLRLLKEWRRLCQKFSLIISKTEPIEISYSDSEDENESENDVEGESDETPPDEYEVGELLSIRYGDPKDLNASSLYFKVRWDGYGSDEDTWEPYDALKSCKEKLKKFVTKGFKEKLLPLPGDVHIVCGGPPYQGMSGFNRYRDTENPLNDDKNRQVVVYMDIIDYLKPKYILMENVVDLLNLAKGFLARYAVARLVTSNYQTKVGIMAAGSYGVPQCRYRVFLWGAQPSERLPPYPLPTHNIATKNKSNNVIPIEFKELEVGYNQNVLQLKTALTLGDAISDLPKVTSFEVRDERNYDTEPETEFQKFISLKRADTLISNGGDKSQLRMLYDHQPYQLSKDDYERVCNISKKKVQSIWVVNNTIVHASSTWVVISLYNSYCSHGAYFTDLGGVIMEENIVQLDPSVERATLESGKPLIPNYAFTYGKGKSKKPFGRLWWDEIVNTVVTRAQPHNQRVLHPEQDRVLTVRENARLQGFPDCYKLHGPVNQKYIQVGNAVAVPVGIALGYAYGMASQGLCDDKHVIKMPFMYPECLKRRVIYQLD